MGPAAAQVAPSADTAASDTSDIRSARSPDDAELEQRLQATFGEIDEFEGITVDVRHGVVHLEGAVVNPNQADEAQRLAQEFAGVVYVDNDVTAETDLADRVTPAVSRLQEYGRAFVEYLPVGLVAIFVILLTGAMARWIGTWEVGKRLRLSSVAWTLVRRSIQVVLVLVGLLVTFDLLGVTSLVGALLGTAGVAGLAIGFAFQDIIENYLAGVLLSLRRPFRINDFVSIGGHEGRVVRMTARELVLLTFEGNHVRMPNATVFKSVLVNYTLNPNRLVVFDVGIGTDVDLVTVQRLGVETLAAMNGILEEPPPFARIKALGDSSVQVRFHGWVDQSEVDFFKVQSEAIRLVKATFDEADIDMPDPTFRIVQASAAEPSEVEGPEMERLSESVQEQARTADVERDGRMEAQVAEEAQRPDEENLLTDDSP